MVACAGDAVVSPDWGRLFECCVCHLSIHCSLPAKTFPCPALQHAHSVLFAKPISVLCGVTFLLFPSRTEIKPLTTLAQSIQTKHIPVLLTHQIYLANASSFARDLHHDPPPPCSSHSHIHLIKACEISILDDP